MSLSERGFWRSILVLTRNYHVVNNKVFACLVEKVEKITVDNKKREHVEVCGEAEVTKHLRTLAHHTQTNCKGFLLFYKLLPKKGDTNIEAVGIVDLGNCSYRCQFKNSNLDDFVICLKNGELCVDIATQRLSLEISSRWAEFVLKPKLLKWSQRVQNADDLEEPSVRGSLQLVDLEKYNNLYKLLKRKYAEKATKFWYDAQESTDPLKFIYEDLAIAAYLIALWNSETVKEAPRAFADLGCGNGLLVYILNSEGYKGYGYDVRARKLWSLYPQPVAAHLHEQVIDPTRFEVPGDVDWLIGNHSDELSPWLPVLAATSRYGMRYFLLPCCAYELSGAKFQRRNSGVSTYQDFYAYAKKLSQLSGYQTVEDRLKIPSTKRLALIGVRRNYPKSVHQTKVREICKFVCEEQNVYPNATSAEVKLREKHEVVRNCTQIDKHIISALVEKIFRLLLAVEGASQESWNTGGRLKIGDIARQLNKDDLRQIKCECGGLKTLLRNKHEIFEFYGNDVIGLRKPQVCNGNSAGPQTVKKRPCFFKQHHPDGCPLKDDECTFLH